MALKTDILVVGSGPAGATTAYYAAKAGANVTIIERKDEVGVPVKCGELIPSIEEITRTFPNVEDAESLFDVPSELVLREIEGIKLVNPKGKETLLEFTGYTTDRDRYDKFLTKRAVSEGADLITGNMFKKIENGVAITEEGPIEYKVIIGADGPGSRVARSLGLPRNKNPYPAVTCQAKGDFDPYVVMFFGGVAPGAYSWIIPKKGKANVGVGFSPKFADGSLREYFDIFSKKQGFELEGELHGKYVPSEGSIKKTVSGNGMVVGDAAGHVISVNGGGVPLALIAARICGNVAAANVSEGLPLQTYEDQWRHVLYKQIKTAAFSKKLADTFAFGSDFRTGLCMAILGKRRMAKMIRCRHVFP